MKALALAALCVVSHSTLAAEPLMGYIADFEGITLQVRSGGCTDKNSFRAQIQETLPLQVTFERVRQDFCEAYFPYGRPVTYTWAELGIRPGARLVITNPRAEIFVR